MSYQQFRKVWGAPVLLAITILFGLLSALLDTDYWYFISWTTMAVPLIIILWKIWGYRISKKLRLNL